MIPFFETFVIDMYNDVPTYVYILLICLLCLFAVLALSLARYKKGLLFIQRFILLEYVALLFFSTVVFRTSDEDVEHHFTPFWSYVTYDVEVRPDLLPENIMNVAVFVPLGLMIGASFKKIKWWKALIIGLAISVTIEALQFFFSLGVSEFDDVFHNTLGCMIGYGIFRLVYSVITIKVIKVIR